MHERGHLPVLLDDVLELLAVRPGSLHVDGTLGRAGHAEAVLERGARVVGVDRDPDALAESAPRLQRFGDAVELHHACFSQLAGILGDRRADSVLLDLGASSPQFDRPERGFSFRADGQLDMRMDPSQGEPLSVLLDRLDADALADAIWRFGEERHSRRVARAILDARPLRGTLHLADVIARVVRAEGRIHPATRTFQALRILVNGELDELDQALAGIPALLAPHGRFVVIAFHSLEDAPVKTAFRRLAGVGGATDLYGHPLERPQFRLVERRARKGESDPNPRARSARVRAIERLP